MSIRFRVMQNKMKGTNNFGKWYGRATVLDEVSTRNLADEISHSTTVTYADVLAVLTELSRQMKSHLQNSQRVVLDGIGAFKVGISTHLVEKSDKFSVANIKNYRIVYTPERLFMATTKRDTVQASLSNRCWQESRPSRCLLRPRLSLKCLPSRPDNSSRSQ